MAKSSQILAESILAELYVDRFRDLQERSISLRKDLKWFRLWALRPLHLAIAMHSFFVTLFLDHNDLHQCYTIITYHFQVWILSIAGASREDADLWEIPISYRCGAQHPTSHSAFDSPSPGAAKTSTLPESPPGT